MGKKEKRIVNAGVKEFISENLEPSLGLIAGTAGGAPNWNQTSSKHRKIAVYHKYVYLGVERVQKVFRGSHAAFEIWKAGHRLNPTDEIIYER